MAELSTVVPRFSESKCVICGKCAALCPHGAITVDRAAASRPVLRRELCAGCGWCVGQCPRQAVECVHAETGEVIWNGYGTIKDWVR
jgi:MinD superfamily P-loop ATPase